MNVVANALSHALKYSQPVLVYGNALNNQELLAQIKKDSGGRSVQFLDWTAGEPEVAALNTVFSQALHENAIVFLAVGTTLSDALQKALVEALGDDSLSGAGSPKGTLIASAAVRRLYQLEATIDLNRCFPICATNPMDEGK